MTDNQERKQPVTSEPDSTSEDEALDDELDEDQQKAFESIMSQIDAGENSQVDAEPEKVEEEPEVQDTEDDFAAELEKVTQEAQAVTESPSDTKGNEEGLDEDQQKAFESIMSQVDAGENSQVDAEPEKVEEEPEVPETEADFAAELEKVAEETENDQSVIPAEGDFSEETEDISDTIDDLLKGITSEDDESELSKADPHDDLVVSNEEPQDRKKVEDIDNSSIVMDAPKPEEPVQRPSTKTLQDLPHVGTEHSEIPTNTATPVPPLQEKQKPRKRWKRWLVMASVIAIISLSMAGFGYWWKAKSFETVGATPFPESTVSNEKKQIKETKETKIVSRVQESVIPDYGHEDILRLQTVANSLNRLRNEVLEKQKEIEELRKYYEDGIDSEIRGIADTLHELKMTTATYKKASSLPRVRLGLDAIQRRDMYIKRLQSPINELFFMSEELLFWSRKAEILAIMAGKTSDFDIDSLVEQTTEIYKRLKKDLDQINIEADGSAAEPLKLIWKDVAKRLKQKTNSTTEKKSVNTTDSAAIWKDICEGNFSEKDRLMFLSAEAARCMAKWEGSDLYLNQLTTLSPEAARYLSEWKGEWLGLNGLVELTPTTAAHLARWDGKVLSLNGLTHLSPKVLDILSQWQGEQIELINVEHMAHWENPKTRLFLSEDIQRKHFKKRE